MACVVRRQEDDTAGSQDALKFPGPSELEFCSKVSEDGQSIDEVELPGRIGKRGGDRHVVDPGEIYVLGTPGGASLIDVTAKKVLLWAQNVPHRKEESSDPAAQVEYVAKGGEVESGLLQIGLNGVPDDGEGGEEVLRTRIVGYLLEEVGWR